eukprot:9760104-Ditylum_brightwellii.AAC.2
MVSLALGKTRLHACIAVMNLSCGKYNKIEIANIPNVLEVMRVNMDWSEDQQLDDYVEGDDIIADDIQHDDNFEVGFGDVSIMPVSCTNYYNGHLI